VNCKTIIQCLTESDIVLADRTGRRIRGGDFVKTFPSKFTHSILAPSEGTVTLLQNEGVWVRSNEGKLEWHVATYDPRSNSGVCYSVEVTRSAGLTLQT